MRTDHPTGTPRRVCVVAPSTMIANLYCRAVGATEDTHLVVAEPQRLRGLSSKDSVVVVVANDPRHVMNAFDQILRHTRAAVSYIDIDTIMGVNRSE